MKWRSIMAQGGEYGLRYTNISLVYQHGSRSHTLGRVYGDNQLNHNAVVAAFGFFFFFILQVAL